MSNVNPDIIKSVVIDEDSLVEVVRTIVISDSDRLVFEISTKIQIINIVKSSQI